jgi:hypothetical protein
MRINTNLCSGRAYAGQNKSSANRRTITVLAGLALPALLVTLAPGALGADICYADQTRHVMQQNGSSIYGRGTLVANREGVEVLARAHNLTPGVAYTAWFAYFNNTAQCLSPHQCGSPDLTMPANNQSENHSSLAHAPKRVHRVWHRSKSVKKPGKWCNARPADLRVNDSGTKVRLLIFFPCWVVISRKHVTVSS